MESNAELESKFSNMFIMLLLGIQSNDLDDVKHYLSEDVYNKYLAVCQRHIANNEMQLYDEMNVKQISINLSDEGDYDVAYVHIVSRYMDYIIDLDTGNKKSGINDHRIELDHDLVFKKKKDAVKGAVVKCPGCGANLDVNHSGKCEYCGAIYSAESYDFILTSITNL
jgi:hypothetical protein